MSRMIELPDDVYARIEEAASTSGNSVAETIASRFPAPAPQLTSANGSEQPGPNGTGQQPRTLADEFTDLVGLIDSGRTDLFQRTGERFSEGLWEKYQEEQAAARALQTGESSSSGIAGKGEAARSLADLAEGLVGQVAGNGPHDLARNHSRYMGEYLEEEDRRRQP